MYEEINELMDISHNEVNILLQKQIKRAFKYDDPGEALIALSSVYLLNAIKLSEDALGPEQSVMWIRGILEHRFFEIDENVTIH